MENRSKKDSGKTEEARLARWCDDQRKAFRQGRLPRAKIERLLGLPSWDWVSDEEYKEILLDIAKRHEKAPHPDSPLGKALAKFTRHTA